MIGEKMKLFEIGSFGLSISGVTFLIFSILAIAAVDEISSSFLSVTGVKLLISSLSIFKEN